MQIIWDQSDQGHTHICVVNESIETHLTWGRQNVLDYYAASICAGTVGSIETHLTWGRQNVLDYYSVQLPLYVQVLVAMFPCLKVDVSSNYGFLVLSMVDPKMSKSIGTQTI